MTEAQLDFILAVGSAAYPVPVPTCMHCGFGIETNRPTIVDILEDWSDLTIDDLHAAPDLIRCELAHLDCQELADHHFEQGWNDYAA